MRKLLHVGFHKTGTTTIQSDLKAARKQLALLGVQYPSQKLVGEPDMAGHHRLAKSLFDDPKTGRLQIAQLLALSQENASPSDTVLLSSEGFNRYNLKRKPGEDTRSQRENYVAEMSRAVGRDTEIVLVLRRPDSYLLSIYQESVKKSSQTRSVTEFRDRPNPLLAFRFQILLYEKYFETVHILIFEDLVRGPVNITAAFLDALGVKGAAKVGRKTHANTSAHPYLTEYKRIRNHAQLSREDQTVLRDAIRTLEASGDIPFLSTQCALLSENERKLYLDDLSDDLDWLRQRLGKMPGAEVFPPVENEPPKCAPMTLTQFEVIHKKICHLL